MKQNGYFNVKTFDDATAGWIWSPNVHVETAVSFQDFAVLQAKADDLGIEQGPGSHVPEAMRAQLQNLDLGNGVVIGEGDLVELVGFIALERDIRASSGESVNCRLTGQPNNDTQATRP